MANILQRMLWKNLRSNKKMLWGTILHKVDLKGIILKPNMILPGNKSKDKISNEEVAKLTLQCLKISALKFQGLLFYLEVNLK